MLKENYRPVSVLDVYTKIVEIIIVEQLVEYFKNIFHEMLCAYRKKYGCQHVIVKLVDSWKFALDNDMFAGTLLMDLSKCFDSIPHGLTIAKMKAYGLSDEACHFMATYLSGRYQRVKISDSRSEWIPVKKGIPQGSALGPFILNIFMNDIFYFIEICLLINYADDNTLSTVQLTIDLVLSALKKDGENAMQWFIMNFMQANPSKFQFMLLKKLTCPLELPNTLEICDTQIKRDSDVKLLGITIDDQLRFNKHVDILCKKAARQLNVMYRFKGIFKFKEKETVYNTFILANFNYCPIVWHFCGKTSTKKIELIQERALRFLLDDHKSTYDELLEKCQYTTLHIRRIKAIAMEVFKSLNNLNPKFMNEIFEIKEIPYELRDTKVLVQPKFQKMTYGKNTFQYYGSHIWNLLPNNIKECTTQTSFKTLLDTWSGPSCQCNICSALT